MMMGLWFYIGHPSVIGPAIFWFLNDNLSKCQWIFTKIGMCIDVVKILVGIGNGQIWSIFDMVYLPATR